MHKHTHIHSTARHSTQEAISTKGERAKKLNKNVSSSFHSLTLWSIQTNCELVCVWVRGTRDPLPHNQDRVHLIDFFSRIHLYLNRTVPVPQRTILSYIHFSRFLFSLILRMQIQLNHFFFIHAISLPFLSLWSLTGKSRKKIEQNRIELNFTEGISVFYPLWKNSMKKKLKIVSNNLRPFLSQLTPNLRPVSYRLKLLSLLSDDFQLAYICNAQCCKENKKRNWGEGNRAFPINYTD